MYAFSEDGGKGGKALRAVELDWITYISRSQGVFYESEGRIDFSYVGR